MLHWSSRCAGTGKGARNTHLIHVKPFGGFAEGIVQRALHERFSGC